MMMLGNKWDYLCNKHLLLSLNLLLLSCGHLLQLRQSEFHTLISNLNTHMDVVKIILPRGEKMHKSLAEERSTSSLPSADMLKLQLCHSAEGLDKRMRGITQKDWECAVTELRERRGGRQVTGTYTDAIKCTQAMLHQWQFTRGTNRLIKPQTVMSRESEEHPTEQRGRESSRSLTDEGSHPTETRLLPPITADLYPAQREMWLLPMICYH